MWQMLFVFLVALNGGMYAVIDVHPLANQTNIIFVKVDSISIPHAYRHIQIDFDADARFNEAFEWFDHSIEYNEMHYDPFAAATNRSTGCTNASAPVCAEFKQHMAYLKNGLRLAYREHSRSAFGGRRHPLAMHSANAIDVNSATTSGNGGAVVVRNEFQFLNATLTLQRSFIRNISDVLLGLQQRFVSEASSANEERLLSQRLQQYVGGIIDYGHLAGYAIQLMNSNGGGGGGGGGQIIQDENMIAALLQFNIMSPAVDKIRQGLRQGVENLYGNELVDVMWSSEVGVRADRNCLNISIEVPVYDAINSPFDNYRIISLPFVLKNDAAMGNVEWLHRVATLFDYVSFNRATNTTVLWTEPQFVTKCKPNGANGAGGNYAGGKTCAYNATISLNGGGGAASNALACELDLFLNRSASNCVLERYGSFDAALYQVNPDTFFCITAAKHGLQIMLEGDSVDSSNRTITIGNSSWFQVPANVVLRFADTILKSAEDCNHSAPNDIYYPRGQLLWLNHTMRIVEKRSSSVPYLYFHKVNASVVAYYPDHFQAVEPPPLPADVVFIQFFHRFCITLIFVVLFLILLLTIVVGGRILCLQYYLGHIYGK